MFITIRRCTLLHDTDDRNNFDQKSNFGDINPNNNVEPKLGNTLDFYNDDMSRKVVGRLFDIPDEEDKDSILETSQQQTAGSIIKGFSDEREPAATSIPDADADIHHGRYSSEGGSPAPSPAPDDETFDRPSGRRRRPGAISNAAGQEPLDEDELGFGLYRKRQPLGAPHREPEEPYQRPDSRRRPQITEDYDSSPGDRPPSRTKPKEYKKIQPERDFDTPQSEPYPARRQKPGARPPARKPRFAVRREDEDDDDTGRSSYERGTPSMRMIVVSVIAGFAMVVLAIIVFQLISLGSQLREAQAEAEVSAERLRQRNELAIENDRLTSDLASAAAEIVRLESLLQASPPAQLGDDPATPTQPYLTHTVQPGQTLGQISEIFYGSAGQWRRIAEANRMSPPYHPHVGQILTIPD